jgi:hypothetical protein
VCVSYAPRLRLSLDVDPLTITNSQSRKIGGMKEDKGNLSNKMTNLEAPPEAGAPLTDDAIVCL